MRARAPAGRLTSGDRALSWLLALGYAAVLLVAQRDTGIARDEGYYFRAGERYWSWFLDLGRDRHAALREDAIGKAFSYNHEHPALLKTLFGASKSQLADRRGWLAPSSAFRLPGILVSALALLFLYRFGASVAGPIAGLSAALLYAAMPRVVYHSQLAAFDAAVAAAWLAVVYAWWIAMRDGGYLPAFSTGVALGVALAVKFNALFLPPVLALHALCARLPARRALWVLGLSGAIGALIFVGHWPWLWTDTVARLREFLAFHARHSYYNMEFAGENYNRPPLPVAYPFVMTLLTTPALTLALAVPGAVWMLRAPRRELGLLWLINLIVPIAIIAWPTTPIFGGTKHWLASMPFLALLAGVAVARAAEAIARPALRAALACAAALPGAAGALHAHPFGLSQYGALGGGVPGAADLGMNRQFWGYAVRPLLPWINDTFPPSAKVYWHDTNADSLAYYRREDLLRADVGDTGLAERGGIPPSDFALVHHELHFSKYEYAIWNAYQTSTPLRVLTLDGVPLVTVYARPPPFAPPRRTRPR